MRILIFYRHFPVAMGRYIHWGLEQAGHEVLSCGPYSKGTIPWGDFEYPKKHWYPPDIETPDMPELEVDALFETIKQAKLGKFDLLVSAADTYFLTGKAPIPHILIGTDPHVVDYRKHTDTKDAYVSMQKHYSIEGDIWMPYGFDPTIHQYLPDAPMTFDVCFIGLQYEHRKMALRAMTDAGYKVWSSLGHIYEEYVELYNRAPIAFNWSSKQDLPARFFEGLAMRRVVLTNRVPDLKEFKFIEDEDYLAFDDIEEAVDKVKIVMDKPHLLDKIARSGYAKVQNHTYADRVKKMLEEVGI